MMVNKKEVSNMNNVFTYLNLAMSIGEVVTTFTGMIHARKALLGSQIRTAIAPFLAALTTVFPTISLPQQLVVDITNVAAGAINKYVFKV
jgi:hypothetical protein